MIKELDFHVSLECLFSLFKARLFSVSLRVDSGSYIGLEGKPIQLKCLVWGADPKEISWKRSSASMDQLLAKVP